MDGDPPDPSDTPGAPDPGAHEVLPPQVREDLIRLLTVELGAACRSARAAGAAPDQLTTYLDERRRAFGWRPVAEDGERPPSTGGDR